jgi:hypothetical protein
MKTTPHLTDERMFDTCMHGGSEGDRQHLSFCNECRARHEDLTTLLAETAEAAATDADEVFTPERLARQRARVLHRIEQDGRPGMVVPFPVGQVGRIRQLPARPAAARWVAGAAAAGLVVGVLAGHFAHDFRVQSQPQATFAAVRPDVPTLATVTATGLSEEEFLGQMELALESTSGATLEPLHEMTPLVWEVAAP